MKEKKDDIPLYEEFKWFDPVSYTHPSRKGEPWEIIKSERKT